MSFCQASHSSRHTRDRDAARRRAIAWCLVVAIECLVLPAYRAAIAGPASDTTPPPTGSRGGAAIATAPNLMVAFIGDVGSSASTDDVLRLILSEGADMVIHSGDFDYGSNPDGWDARITKILGADYPYFACVGNHDLDAWPRYQQKLLQRFARVKGASFTGDLGVQSACTYRGLFFILSGVGVTGEGHEAFIHHQLEQDQHVWRICSWHKDQNALQVGGKGDEVGWRAYEEAIRRGAIVATGHEHSYARTRTLIDAEKQKVDASCPDADQLCVGAGRSFVFQSGLGGRSIRVQQRCLPATFPYGCHGEWAKIYTASQGATYGALFIVFNVDGDPNRARGYFKNVAGAVVDSFTVTHDGAR